MGKNVKIFFGGCNFRKGKYLAFCRLSNSQRGGRGFESHLLHHKARRTKDLARIIHLVGFSEMTDTWPIFSASSHLLTIAYSPAVDLRVNAEVGRRQTRIEEVGPKVVHTDKCSKLGQK